MIEIFVFKFLTIYNVYKYFYIIVESIGDYYVKISRVNINHSIGCGHSINKKLTKKILCNNDIIFDRRIHKDILNDTDHKVISDVVFQGEPAKLIMKYKIKT